MDSKHKWTFNDFVTRVEELSNTPKRFCHVVFNTMLREFEFGIMDTEEYGIEVLKDIFFPEGTIFTTPFPQGLIKSLHPNNEPSVADEDKTKIRDDQIQQIVEKMESQRKQPPPSPPLFEDILEKLKTFCRRDDLSHDEAIKMLEFVHNLDCLEIQWLIRILTCTVKSKLKCSRADMQAWFGEVINQPLSRVSSSLIGKPHAPMLLLKTSTGTQDYTTKVLKFCGDSFYVETKYDGERFHVHKMKNSYRFFSRKPTDYSHKFGTNASKEFAAKLHPLFKEDVAHCVLDCEVLVWDRKHKRLVGKNEAASDFHIYDVKNLLESKDDDNRRVHRVLCVFDILHLNGVDLAEWTLSARLRILFEDIFNQDLLSEDLVFLSKYTLTLKRSDFLTYYNQAMDQKLEGIVIKSLYSTYQFGSRNQTNGWFKIKPDYGLAPTLDLAILAIRFDNGHPISFELGALISKERLNFKFVGTVSGNIRQLDRDRLLANLKGENGLLNNNKPEWIYGYENVNFVNIKKSSTNIKFVDKKNLAVVEIRASGIMRSEVRFPSIISIRYEKEVSDCDTLKDIEEYEAKLRKFVDPNNESSMGQRKRKTKMTVPIQFKKFHSMNSDSTAHLICCYNIKNSVTPHDLDDLKHLGFSFIQNLTKECVAVVTDEPNCFKIKGAIKQNICHIVKADWLKRCKEHKTLVGWNREDIIYDCPNAQFSLFEDSPDVQVANDNIEEEEEEIEREKMTIDPELDDLIAADSDPEISLDGLNMNDSDEEMA